VSGGRWSRIGLRAATAAVLVFIYVPIALVFIYAFNPNRLASWPPTGFTLEWLGRALNNSGLRDAFVTSLLAAAGATTIALVLGSLAAFAVARHTFFGRDTVSFLVVLPIALPGIVTGMALSTTFGTLGVPLGLATVVIGHATFCVVIVYNNVVARLRRTAPSQEEASADLGADTWSTARRITLPAVRTALIAGGLLAFALSFDEIIVTIFTAGGVQTLPIWIFQNFRIPNQLPVVNVAGMFAILLSIIPVYIAQRLTTDAGAIRGR
jgi:putative spermidine/putrescine transport system permease protein